MRLPWTTGVLPLLVLLGALALRVFDPTPVREIRNTVFDTYQRLQPRPPQPAPVLLVDIDERSLNRIGQWPWPRTKLAGLVDRLTEAGAATIALDIVFAEPDMSSPDELIRAWREVPAMRPAAEFLARSAVPDHDDLFADAIGRAPSVLGNILSADGAGTFDNTLFGVAALGENPRPFLFAFDGAVTNLEVLEAAAQGLGALNVVPDQDGVVRRLPVLLRQGETIVPSLWADALRVAQRENSFVVRSAGASQVESFGENSGIESVRIGGAIVRTDANGQIWLHSARARPDRTVSAVDVLEGRVPQSRIQGQIVFVGTSAPGLKDGVAVPLARALPGFQLHGQAVEQAVHASYLSRPAWAAPSELLATLVAGLLLTAAFWSGRLGAVGLGYLTFGLLAALAGLSWQRYAGSAELFDPVYPGMATLAVYLVASYWGFRRTEVEKRRVRQTFSFYLSPAMVERLTRSAEPLRLGGEDRDLTLLFCDVRNFTDRAERMSAQELTGFLNRFLTPMTDAILAENGTVDKYMGDAIMAFWNAPVDEPAHAGRGLKAAIEMRRRCAELNAALADETDADGRPVPPLQIGIGLHTGLCSVGNMGSMQRFDYTAMGDNVNVASRLEGMAKLYAVDIVFSDAVRADAGDIPAIELDVVQVKGRAAPTRLFTVPPDGLVASPEFDRFAATHAAMLASYRTQDWPAARAALAECRTIDVSGTLHPYYAVMAARIDTLEADPPPADWGGVYIADSK
jgi:adenylate cyclase